MSHKMQAPLHETRLERINALYQLHEQIPGFLEWRKQLNTKPIIKEHPFLKDISNWNPSINMLIHTSLHYPRKVEIIDTEDKLIKMAKDFEWYNEYTVILKTTMETYLPLIAIIQISSFEKDYIIDCISLFNKIPKYLTPFFQNSTKVKIFHSSCHIIHLQQNFNIYTVGMLNCQEAYQQLKHNMEISFEDMVFDLLGTKILNDNQYNWNIHPLQEDAINIISKETRYLFACWIKIKDSSCFSEFGPFPQSKIDSMQTQHDPDFSEVWDSYIGTLPKDQRKLFAIIGQYKLYESLFNWRDHICKEIDTNTELFLPETTIQFITRSMPIIATQLLHPALQLKHRSITDEHIQQIICIVKTHRGTMFLDRKPIISLIEIPEIDFRIHTLSESKYARKQRRHRQNRKIKKQFSQTKDSTHTKTVHKRNSSAKRVSAFLRTALRYKVTQHDILTHIEKLPKSLRC